MSVRIERDFIGEVEIPSDALYGIHSYRARENFPFEGPIAPEWYCSIAQVKWACYLTIRSFKKALHEKYSDDELPFALIEDHVLDALIQAAEGASRGDDYEFFIVPSLCGGAGTSFNMNMNEILANRALMLMGMSPGDYSNCDPVEQANMFQSTNDVIPSSLKVCVMGLLDSLEAAINHLREEVERKEKAFAGTLRLGYTQMQRAVPTSFGRLFSTYSDALSRDWWRVSKAFERIKVVNLGGSAIGTGITVPRYFIFEAVQQLREIVNRPITRGENLTDPTANADSFVEVHAILKAHAVNLEKMSSDLRLLASDINENHPLFLPPRQVGSSIMPGKVNPVISEYIISAAHRVYSNDSLISSLAGQGCLELNAYLPAIGTAMIESLKLLTSCCYSICDNMIHDIRIDEYRSKEEMLRAPSIVTALVPYLGYNRCSEIASEMKRTGKDIEKLNDEINFIDPQHLKRILEPGNLLRLGFSLSEIKAEKSEFINKDEFNE